MRQQGFAGWLKNDVTNRGVTAWLLSAGLLGFYILLYLSRQLGWKAGESPVNEAALWIGNRIASLFHAVGLGGSIPEFFQHFGLIDINYSGEAKWVLYGWLYSLAILAGGLYMFWKYSHNRYQVVRTSVVIFVQVSFAFSIPQILKFFDQPEFYFSYLWPLKIEYFYPSKLASLFADSPIFVLWSIVGSLILVPLLGIFFGKRWYCSWVCGCGGLANTAGEPFRHLTPTRSEAWAFEKYAIHITLGICLLLTGLVAVSYVLEVGDVGASYPRLQTTAAQMQSLYGLVVTIVLQGVIGVGLYPLGGTRIWCRNFCPMAAVLGLVQKFGRFRITVKDDMCISCGLCSKYCEMGIDVRSYAQANEDFTRAACVGCGLCEEVCPRGVLHLENDWEQDPQELTVSSLLSESYKSA